MKLCAPFFEFLCKWGVKIQVQLWSIHYLYSLMPPAHKINWNIVSKSLVIPHGFYCLASYRTIPAHMPHNYFILFFRYLALAILSITLEQGFKAPSNMNVSELLDLHGHIKTKPMSKAKNPSCMNYSALEPVLFEKPHNSKLSCLVFRVTTFFQFESMKAALEILLQYMHDFDENLKAVYSKLVTNNNFDHKSYDVRQCVLTYLALLNYVQMNLQIANYTINYSKEV